MPTSSPQQFLGFLLGSTYRRISNSFARALRPHDITPEQWSVLLMICDRSGISQKEVAAAAAKDQPTTARIVELLIKKGFIRKSMNPDDRRAFQLYATEEGRSLIGSTIALEQQTIDNAVTGLNPEQLEQLRSMLELIYNNTGNTHQE
ncbi:MarR family winged helix-turn-helix transcriptional regulator [Paenibacillus sp. MMS20-IR301]|uniref:MarR family winged helix-turn-helix transcriptional regulator n=1 Tax=Paenibacillus sp. MMS20-IR301 TaxID=2895946 RepID=UPI0028E591F9|nr:MarR family winged helix-turn-helix transcriptional regulator [Paenibacillus sp. MMS20-IR301]WNS45698.1 MarR family winged helix-turn-helix transcriptional regulator [Paenibacillus sp. MMS20-IR301]